MLKTKYFGYGKEDNLLIVGTAFSMKDFYEQASKHSLLMQNSWAVFFEISREKYLTCLNSDVIKVI